MLARLLADSLVVLHLGFVLFVVLGGLLTLRWPRTAWVHLPAAVWGAGIELAGGICPLTPLENHLRHLGGQAGYSGGFVEHYLLSVLYPSGLTSGVQIGLGLLVIVLNLTVYAVVIDRLRRRRQAASGAGGDRRARAHGLALVPVSALLCLAAGSLGPAGAAAGAGAGDPARYQERMEVRETQLLFDPPPKLERWGAGGVRPEEVSVTEDGEPCRVLKIEPLSAESRPWKVMVYIDRVLAEPETALHAAVVLAGRARQLAALGEVEIVEADPSPHLALPATGDPDQIRRALGEAAGRHGELFSGGPEGWRRPDESAFRRQADDLLTYIADQPSGGPRLLLLVADAPQLSANQLERLRELTGRAEATKGTAPPAAPPAPGSGVTEALAEAARELAAYGWVTVPLPVHPLRGERIAPNGYDPGGIVVGPAGPQLSPSINFLALAIAAYQWAHGRPISSPHATDLRGLDAKLLQAYEPLHVLASVTAGGVVGNDAQLDAELEALNHRWRLWFQASSPLGMGLEHSVLVRTAPGGQSLRARRFVKSVTPEAMAEARLRRELREPSFAGTLRVVAVAETQPASPGSGSAPAAPAGGEPTGEPLTLRLTLPLAAGHEAPAAGAAARAPADQPGAGDGTLAGPTPGETEPAPLRLSAAFVTVDGVVVFRHQLLPLLLPSASSAGERTAVWTRDVHLDMPPHAVRAAVEVEELVRSRWGGAVLELGSPPAAGAKR